MKIKIRPLFLFVEELQKRETFLWKGTIPPKDQMYCTVYLAADFSWTKLVFCFY